MPWGPSSDQLIQKLWGWYICSCPDDFNEPTENHSGVLLKLLPSFLIPLALLSFGWEVITMEREELQTIYFLLT